MTRPGRFGAEILVVDACVAEAICDDILARVDKQGFVPARLAAEGRHNDETFLIDPQLGACLVRCLANHATIVHSDDLIEVYRYAAGQHIELHVDSPRAIARGALSTATLLVYLNDGFEGGQTLFPVHGCNVQAIRGRALVFSHGVPHAAEAVRTGVKFVARMSVAVQW